jgi:hypothetical protein
MNKETHQQFRARQMADPIVGTKAAIRQARHDLEKVIPALKRMEKKYSIQDKRALLNALEWAGGKVLGSHNMIFIAINDLEEFLHPDVFEEDPNVERKKL